MADYIYDLIGARKRGLSDDDIVNEMAPVVSEYDFEGARAEGKNAQRIISELGHGVDFGSRPDSFGDKAGRAVQKVAKALTPSSAPAAPVRDNPLAKFAGPTVLPRHIASEYDLNLGDTRKDIIAPGFQGAYNLANAPRIPESIQTHNAEDILAEFARSTLPRRQDNAASRMLEDAPAVAKFAVPKKLPTFSKRLSNVQREVMGVDPTPLPIERETGETLYNTVIPAPAMAVQQTGKSIGAGLRQIGDYAGSDTLAETGADIADVFGQRQAATEKAYLLDENSIPSDVRSGISSFVQMLGPGALGVVRAGKALKAGLGATKAATAATRATLLPMATMTETEAYDKYRDRGHDILPSTVGAGVEGLVEYWTEKLGMNPVTKYLTSTGKKGLASLIEMGAKAGIGDQIGEQLASHTQELTQRIMAKPESSTEERQKSGEDYFTVEGKDGLTDFQRVTKSTAISALTMNILMPGAAAAGKRFIGSPAGNPLPPPPAAPQPPPGPVGPVQSPPPGPIASEAPPSPVAPLPEEPEPPVNYAAFDVNPEDLDYSQNLPFQPNRVTFEAKLVKNGNTEKTAVLLPPETNPEQAKAAAAYFELSPINVGGQFYLYDPEQITANKLVEHIQNGESGIPLGYGTPNIPENGIPWMVDLDGHGTLDPAEIAAASQTDQIGMSGVAPDIETAVAKIREMGRGKEAEIRGLDRVSGTVPTIPVTPAVQAPPPVQPEVVPPAIMEGIGAQNLDQEQGKGSLPIAPQEPQGQEAMAGAGTVQEGESQYALESNVPRTGREGYKRRPGQPMGGRGTPLTIEEAAWFRKNAGEWTVQRNFDSNIDTAPENEEYPYELNPAVNWHQESYRLGLDGEKTPTRLFPEEARKRFVQIRDENRRGSQYSLYDSDTLSPEAVAQVEAMIAQALPSGKATVSIVGKITPPVDSDAAFAAHGKIGGKIAGVHQLQRNITSGEVRSIITLAVDGATEATGYHEILHAAEALGVISPQDAKILERAYPDKGGVKSSERRADAFADHVQGKKAQTSVVRTIFNRVMLFLKKLKQLFTGKGWRTSEDVFNDLMSGKLKRNAQGVAVPDAGAQFAAAWHGGPHDFDKFSSAHIGTGEGAQAYGYGLYFAGKKEVAEYYKKTLAENDIRIDGKRSFEWNVKDWTKGLVIKHKGNIDNAIMEAQEVLKNATKSKVHMSLSVRKMATETIWELEDLIKEGSVTSHQGRLYHVELAPAEDEFLLWDRPLSEQSEKVKAAIKDAFDNIANRESDYHKASALAGKQYLRDDDTGQSIYRIITDELDTQAGRETDSENGPQAASAYLHSLGIRGIKYLDGSSRGKGEGDYNYVIFSDEDVTITSKFSLAKEKFTPCQEKAVRAAFGTPPTALERAREFKKDLGKSMTQGIFDQFSPIKEIDMGAYIKARMTKGADSTLEAVMLYGKPYIDSTSSIKVEFDSGNKGMNGFAKILSQLDGEHDRFLKWVAGHRAARLKTVGLENLMDDETIKALKSLDTDGTPENKLANGKDRKAIYRKALKEMNDFNDAVLKVAVARGLINDATRQMYKDLPYIPFYRLQDEGVVAGFGVTKGLVNQTAWKKLKGGTNKLNDDMLANMLKNWAHLISASAKNDASRLILTKAVELGAALEVPGGYPGKGVVSFRENTTTVLKKTPSGDYTRVQAQPLPRGTIYMENGIETVSDGTVVPELNIERHFIVSDPHLLDAITSLGPTMKVPKVMRGFKNILTTVVTINPTFKIRNLIRDSVASIALSELSYNPLINIGKGYGATAKKSETRAQMMAGGGLMRFGSMLDGATADNARKLIDSGVPVEHILDSPNKVSAFIKKYVVGAFDAYQEFGDRSEQVNRAALYKELIKKGYTADEAAFWARDLMDFSMSGSWSAIRFLTQTVPFFNARLQGIYKLGRSAKADKKRFGIAIGGVVMASLALWLKYRDDDDWKQREEWDRNNYWWFKVGDKAFRIPKPFEIGAVGTIAERSAEYMTEKEMTGKRFVQQMRDIVSQQLSMNPTPQIVKPMLDLWANKDAFTQRPIETLGMDRLLPEDRYTDSTSGTAKLLGQLGLPNPAQAMMGRYDKLSPVQVDSLIRGYFSWLGVIGTTALDYGIFRPLSDKVAPTPKLKDVFFVGNFVEFMPSNSSRYVTGMYEQAKEIEQVYNSYRLAAQSGDIERRDEIANKQGDKLMMYQDINSLKEESAEINRQIKQVLRSNEYSAQQKRQAIDGLKQRQNAIARPMDMLNEE